MLKRSLLSLFCLLLAGCNTMKIEDFAGNQPELKLEQYFLGGTWAWGIFEDRFGNFKRSFTVHIDGRMANGQLILDEDFLYNDGETDRRIWTITPQANGHYRGTAEDVVGEASGQVVGNALNWQYLLDLPVGEKLIRVKFNDWMFLQPNQVLFNKAIVSKWGVHLGTVLIFFSKQQPVNQVELHLNQGSHSQANHRQFIHAVGQSSSLAR
jgi:hypothetical protein